MRPVLSRRIAWWLFATGLTLYLALSAQGLLLLGMPYDATWGPPIAKIHPGTWLVGLAYVLLLTSYGHPLRTAMAQLAAQRILLVYLACVGFCFCYSVLLHGTSGAAFIIDTLIMPAVAVLALLMLGPDKRYACLVLTMVLLVVNAFLGLGETLMQQRLIPLQLAGQEEIVEDIFRPSALLGHPLNNSIITATVMPAVIYLRISSAARLALMLLWWVALLAFGGRASFVLATAAFGSYYAVRLASDVLHGRYGYRQLTGGMFVALLSIAVIGGAVAVSGIGERIFHSLVWDSSAAVRARIWDIFQFIPDQDLLIGVSPADMARYMWRLGLHGPGESIENFWLVMFLQLGVLGFVPFALAMGCAMLWLWRNSTGLMRLSILVFFAAASTNNSLATKTNCLLMLFVVVAITRQKATAPLDRRWMARGSAPFAGAEMPPRTISA